MIKNDRVEDTWTKYEECCIVKEWVAEFTVISKKNKGKVSRNN
jgi:hypothetical protein